MTSSSLNNYATTTNLESTGSALSGKIVSLSGTLTNNYALTTALNSYATTTSLANYATTTNLASTGSTLVTSLANYATTASLANYATTTSLGSYVTTSTANSTYAPKTPTINASTAAALTIDSTYNNQLTTINNGSAITVLLNANLSVGFNCSFMQLGAGKITVTASSPATISSYGNQYRSAGPYAVVSVICTATNTYILYGNTII